MELWIWKVLALLCLFGVTLGCGLLPVWLVRTILSSRTGSRATFILSGLNCMAGGVFLATTFLHLLPDVQESTAAFVDEKRYHVAECIICAGFFLIMLLEHLMMGLQHHYSDFSISVESGATDNIAREANQQRSDDDSRSDHAAQDDEKIAILGEAVMKQDSTTRQKHKHYNYGSLAPSLDTSGHENCKKSAYSLDVSHEKLKSGTGQVQNSHHSDAANGRKESQSERPSSSFRPRSQQHTVVEQDGGSVHIIQTTHHQRHHTDAKQLQGIRSFVLLIALSLHTVFEGIALGLQSSATEVSTLFAALAIHKSIIAFTLGLRFAENVSRTSRVLLFVFFFSLMSPLGVVVGIVVTETSSGSGVDIANAVLQGLATGTFIHVTFFEVLQREVGQDHSIAKVLAVILGFVVIAAMNLLVDS